MATRWPLTHTAPEVKIVWRLAGTGEPTFTYRGPNGRLAELTFGPQANTMLDPPRDDAEWGAGFLFDQPGCWRITIERAGLYAEVALEVA